MEFFKCSIAGVKYGRGVTEIERTLAARAGIQLPHEAPSSSSVREMAFNFDDGCVLLMYTRFCASASTYRDMLTRKCVDLVDAYEFTNAILLKIVKILSANFWTLIIL